MSAPVESEINKLQRELLAMDSAKTKEKKVKHTESAIKVAMELGLGFPTQMYDMLNGEFTEIILDEDVEASVKAQRLLGYSYYAIDKSRKERVSRKKADAKKDKSDKTFDRSVIIYDIQTGKKKYDSETLKKHSIGPKWQEANFGVGLASDKKFKEKLSKENKRK